MRRLIYLTIVITLFFGIVVLNMNHSEAVNRYEMMFDDDVRHHIRVYMTSEEWLGMGDDLVRAAITDDYMRTGIYRDATVEYEDSEGTVILEHIGIRTKGNTTRVIPEDRDGNINRAHFKLKFDPFGTDYEDRRLFSLNELYLKSNMNGDTSYIREDYAYDLMADYGVQTSKSSFCTLTFYVDGVEKDFGVYTMIEPINKEFIEKRFPKKASTGNLYKCLWQNYGPANLSIIRDKRSVGVKNWYLGYRPSYDLQTNISNPKFDDIFDFTYNLTTARDREYEAYINRSFNINNFLTATALNVAIGMPDDYWAMGNNYYLYFNPLGRIEYMPYDYDNSLGAGWDGSQFGGYEGIATADIMRWNNTASKLLGRSISFPLIEKALKVDRYREYYLEQFENILSDEKFTYAYFEEKALKLKELYKGCFSNIVDPNADVNLYNVKWYFDTKRESLEKELHKKSFSY